MKKFFAMGAVMCLFGAGLVGCQHTAEGVSADTSAVGQKAAETAQNAGKAVDNAAVNTADAVKDAGKAVDHAAANGVKAVDNAASNAADATKDAAASAGANLDIRPKVKTAILADKELNNPANEIHASVDATSHVVMLGGHVQTNEMKKRAGEIAMKTIKDAGKVDTVKNELTVASH